MYGVNSALADEPLAVESEDKAAVRTEEAKTEESGAAAETPTQKLSTDVEWD